MVDAANVRHLVSPLAKQAAVLLTRNAKAIRKKNNNKKPPSGGFFSDRR